MGYMMTFSNNQKFLLSPFLKIPVLGAQLTGSFPLSLNVSLRKTVPFWRNVGAVVLILKVIFLACFVQLFGDASVKFEKLNDVWSNTMMSAEMVTLIVTTTTDFTFACILLWRRQRFSELLQDFEKILEDIWSKSEIICDKNWRMDCYLQDTSIKWPVAIILTMVMTSFASGALIYIPWYVTLFPEWTKAPWVLAMTLGYYGIVMHFRLLGLFPVVVLLRLLRSGFALLGKNIECLSKPDVKWIMDMYTELEKLLRKLHSLFDFQLVCCGMVSILVSLLSIFFDGVFVLIRLARGVRQDVGSVFSQFVPIVPWMVSLCLVLYLLCDASTGMTTAANECIWAFRKCPQMNALNSDERQKVMLFYVEKCTRPPRVSPKGLFTIGRSLIPKMLGMVTTYLIVLYQFESDDHANK